MSQTRRRYTGTELNVTYDQQRCIHAAECVRGLPHVFNPQQRPWINLQNANADDITSVVLRCPTGALQLEHPDGTPIEVAETINRILLNRDGPLYLRGKLRITNPQQTAEIDDTRIALCRCGASANKPFCDNSHQRIGFSDAGHISEQYQTLAEGESLTITLLPNGPLLLQGPFEIVNADHTVQYCGTKAALCRCGGSANKPFCDGTHQRIGFSDQLEEEQHDQ